MPVAGYSASAASGSSTPQSFSGSTYINFGAGYIDAPSSQTTTAKQDSTAAAGGGSADGASNDNLQDLTGKDKTIYWIVGGIGALGIVSLTAFFIFHKR